MIEADGVKVGTKEESFWLKLKKDIEKDIEQNKYKITINEEILKLAEKKLKEEGVTLK